MKQRAFHRGLCITLTFGLLLVGQSLAIAMSQPASDLTRLREARGIARAFAQFALWGSNGYRISVTGSSQGVRLIASRRHEAAMYLDREGIADRDSIKARFGHLGKIDLSFHPTKRWLGDVERCDFFGHQIYRGYFTGNLSFRGERNFTFVRRQRVHGEAGGPLAVKCDRGQRYAGPRAIRSATAGLDPKLEANSTISRRTIGARTFVVGGDAIADLLPLVKSGLSLKLSTLPQQGVPYRAEAFEDRRRLVIFRLLVAKGPGDGFSVGADGKEATVKPPKPFSGEGEYRACSLPLSWRGTLKVSLPGLPNVPLAGRKFFTQLTPHKKCTASDAEEAALAPPPRK